VKTCPTGIDIRNGLQMECINCTQCIDACNEVMQKIDRPPDLIRYSSQMADGGQRNILVRARVMIYPLILAVIASLFLFALFSKQSFNAILLRDAGNPFSISDDGQVRNVLKLKLTNRSDEPMSFQIEQVQPAGVRLELSEERLALDPQATETFHLVVFAPPEIFRAGRTELTLKITNHDGINRDVSTMLIGPRSASSVKIGQGENGEKGEDRNDESRKRMTGDDS
jgi:polyferredoxin